MAALREVLTYFSFHVDDGELKRADQRVKASKESIRGLVSAARNIQIGPVQLGKELPASLASAASKVRTLTQELEKLDAKALAVDGLSPEMSLRVRALADEVDAIDFATLEEADADTQKLLGSFSKLSGEVRKVDDKPIEDVANAAGKAEEKTEGLLEKLGGLKALGFAVAAATLGHGLAEVVHGMQENVAELQSWAQQLDVTAQEVQALDFAAGQMGVRVLDLRDAIGDLAVKQGEAVTRGGELKKAFADIGVEIENADGSARNNIDVFRDLVNEFGNVKTQAEKAALAKQLFGASGKKILPILEAGTGALDEQLAAYERLGGGISDQAIKATEDYEKELRKLDVSVLGLKSSFASSLFPTLSRGVEILSDWIGEVRELTKGVDLGRVALTTLGGVALVAFGPAVIAALPLIATVAALVLLTDELVTTYRGGKSVLSDFWDSATDRDATEDMVGLVNLADELVQKLITVASAFKAIGKASSIKPVWLMDDEELAEHKKNASEANTSFIDADAERMQSLRERQKKRWDDAQPAIYRRQRAKEGREGHDPDLDGRLGSLQDRFDNTWSPAPLRSFRDLEPEDSYLGPYRPGAKVSAGEYADRYSGPEGGEFAEALKEATTAQTHLAPSMDKLAGVLERGGGSRTVNINRIDIRGEGANVDEFARDASGKLRPFVEQSLAPAGN